MLGVGSYPSSGSHVYARQRGAPPPAPEQALPWESSVWFIIPFFFLNGSEIFANIWGKHCKYTFSFTCNGKISSKNQTCKFLTIGIWETSLVGSAKDPLVMELILMCTHGELSRAFVGEGAAEALPTASHPLGFLCPPVALGEHSHFLFFPF